MVWTYSHPYSASNGWIVAQPTSVFQNQRVVAGVARLDHAST
jgi:hypothetical protein